MTEDIEERAEHLKCLKKGDFIWVVEDHPMFKMYDNYCAMDSSKYLGYDSGDEDADYNDSIYAFKATSPTVYAPTKMAFVAKFINGGCRNDIAYVFSSNMHDFECGDFRFGQHIIMPHDHFRGYKSQCFYLDALQLEHGVEIDMEDVFLNEQDCIKECRERNNKHMSIREIDLIERTINSLKEQFAAFKKSDIFIDHEKQILNDLHSTKH